MNRRAVAVRLAVLIVLSGLLPIALLSVGAIELVRRRAEQASQDALEAVAAQAGARIESWLLQQRETLRTVAMALGGETDARRRLAEVVLDAPSLANVRRIDGSTPKASLPQALRPEQVLRALQGEEVTSETYIADLSPAMDVCVPAGGPGRAVCATLDLLELQRQVQRIRVGTTGTALAFDRTGRLVAAGAGTLRAAVLTGEPISESERAREVSQGIPGPTHFLAATGEEVIAGWAFLPDLGWSIAVEQPVGEALRQARAGLFSVAAAALLAVLISLALGTAQARRTLASLEREERWRTAGRIAAGITHDLGHRLVILQQTAHLAEQNDATWLPLIAENLTAEVTTLKKFVGDFADLTREAQPAEFLPIELNAFAESVKNTAEPHGKVNGVRVSCSACAGEVWARGDRYLLSRATLNLVYNAIEASPQGAEVDLRVGNGSGRAILEVEDRGTGIDADRLATLFDSFASTKRTGAHVGMGLPNVRRIVDAHGGTVTVRSLPGKGSVFTISLPLDAAPPDQPAS